MSEFTGERVIPGEVEDDLWAEHLARYVFAARFAEGARALDLGCGSGYGTAVLAKAAKEAVGVDVSIEAVTYAIDHYKNARYLPLSATSLPFSDDAFDLITAFEVIEHLSDWHLLLKEARRVLRPGGRFFVSTPNKLYYAAARGESGPNPFHEHEFEYAEFREALETEFPHVKILLQDRLESFGFYEPGTAQQPEAQILKAPGDPTEANFFFALCSDEPLEELPPFLFVPSAVNLLRERELHIEKLEKSLAEFRSERDTLLAEQNRLHDHLDHQNKWAKELELKLKAAQLRVVRLQEEFAAEQSRATKVIGELNAENAEKTQWAQDTEERLGAEVADLKGRLKETIIRAEGQEKMLAERTEWARALDEQNQKLVDQLAEVQESRWIKLGRQLGVGPQLDLRGPEVGGERGQESANGQRQARTQDGSQGRPDGE